MKKNISRFVEENELTKVEQAIYDFCSENPGATSIECCKEVYGRCDVFLLKNLSSHLTGLRKKGYLYYTHNGQLWDLGRTDTKLEIKLKIQGKLGKSMIGYLKSNIHVMHQASDKRQLEPVKDSLKEAVQVLIQNKVVNLAAVRKMFLNKPQKLLK